MEKKVTVTSLSDQRALRWLAGAVSDWPEDGVLQHIRRIASYDDDVVLLAATDGRYVMLCAETGSPELAEAEASILPEPEVSAEGEIYTTIDEDPGRFAHLRAITPKCAPLLRVTVNREDLMKVLEGVDDERVQLCIFNGRIEVRSKSSNAVRQYALLVTELTDSYDPGEEKRWWKPELLK